MKILVTGANGQLGMSLRKRADQVENDWFFTDVEELDITDAAAVKAMVAQNRIDTIINCAAYTNVDAAEDNEPLAERLNAQAVENLALAMKEVGGRLIHISTDYVFGGEPHNTPCREDLPACPTGAYGRTKLHGEEAILRSGVRYLIVRTSWLYSEYGKNFLKTMLRLTSEKPSLKVVFDQVGTPTYAGDLAEAILKMAAQEGRDGIYHYSNEGVCSWYDFAKAIAEYSGHTECAIQPCHSDEFPSKVVRPAYSVLDKTKVKETFGLSVPYWTDSLKKCLKNLSEPLC